VSVDGRNIEHDGWMRDNRFFTEYHFRARKADHKPPKAEFYDVSIYITIIILDMHKIPQKKILLNKNILV